MISGKGSDENRLTSFLVKLWNILESEDFSKVICWDISGKSFHILDGYGCCEEVLPRFFKHKNMASFVRQLNLYGFKKITSIDRCTQDNLNDHMQFAHAYFIRDQPHLLKNIKRNYTAPRRLSNHQQIQSTEASPYYYQSASSHGYHHHQQPCANGGSLSGVEVLLDRRDIAYDVGERVAYNSGSSSNSGRLVPALRYVDLPGEQIISENGERMTLLPEADMSHIIDELNSLHMDQANTTSRLNDLARDNEALWNELTRLRNTYDNQGQNISKLLQFLVTLIQPAAGNTVSKHQHRFQQSPLKRFLPYIEPLPCPSESADSEPTTSAGDSSTATIGGYGEEANQLLQVLVSLVQTPSNAVGHHHQGHHTGASSKRILPFLRSSNIASGRRSQSSAHGLTKLPLEKPLYTDDYGLSDVQKPYMIANNCSLTPQKRMRGNHVVPNAAPATVVPVKQNFTSYEADGLGYPATDDLPLSSNESPTSFVITPKPSLPVVQSNYYCSQQPSPRFLSHSVLQHSGEMQNSAEIRDSYSPLIPLRGGINYEEIGEGDDDFEDLDFATDMKDAVDLIADKSPLETAAFNEKLSSSGDKESPEEVEFEITVKDEPYSGYLVRIGSDCVLLWLGRTRRSTTVAFGHQLMDIRSARVLEPLNYNSTILANISTKLSAILYGKQVFFTTDLSTELSESEFWRDAFEELKKGLITIMSS